MKIKKEKKLADGKTELTLILEPDEYAKVIVDGAHYQLGYPHEDVIFSDQIYQARRVTWCVVEQRWIV